MLTTVADAARAIAFGYAVVYGGIVALLLLRWGWTTIWIRRKVRIWVAEIEDL